jgi:hypothetical protein
MAITVYDENQNRTLSHPLKRFSASISSLHNFCLLTISSISQARLHHRDHAFPTPLSTAHHGGPPHPRPHSCIQATPSPRARPHRAPKPHHLQSRCNLQLPLIPPAPLARSPSSPGRQRSLGSREMQRPQVRRANVVFRLRRRANAARTAEHGAESLGI